MRPRGKPAAMVELAAGCSQLHRRYCEQSLTSHSIGYRDCSHDIGRRKILAFEQQWKVVASRQGIGGAIGNIQPSGMTALAETQKSLPRKPGESGVMGYDFDLQPAQ